MKRRIAAFLGATLAASALVLVAPAPPASADTNVCAGQGTATTSPIFYPVRVVTTGTTASVTVLAPNTASFAFAFGGLGVCAPGPKSLTATGTVSGWCGHSSGTGVTGQGHRFAWVSAASKLILTGEVTGIVNAAPDPTIAGNSCLTGATTFIVTGAVVLYHCLILKQKGLTTVTIPLPPIHTLTTVLSASLHATVTGGTQHYWTKVCV